jgi:hypothetical protein
MLISLFSTLLHVFNRTLSILFIYSLFNRFSCSLVQITELDVRITSVDLLSRFVFDRSDPLLLGPNNQYLSKIIAVFAEVLQIPICYLSLFECHQLSFCRATRCVASSIKQSSRPEHFFMAMTPCTYAEILFWFCSIYLGFERWDRACNGANCCAYGWFVEATATNLAPGRTGSYLVRPGATTSGNASVNLGCALTVTGLLFISGSIPRGILHHWLLIETVRIALKFCHRKCHSLFQVVSIKCSIDYGSSLASL